MSIEDVFNPGKECSYLVDKIVSGIPRKVARKVVTDFLEENPDGIVWAFYRRLWMPVKEGIVSRGEQFNRSCYVRNVAVAHEQVPEHKLFPDVPIIYLQLCAGRVPQGIGFVEKNFGAEVFTTEIGHYEFSS